MKSDIFINHDICIPAHELDITTSRAGGPGGQHVNKADTRITVRWNIPKTAALNDEQKARVMQYLQSQLTSDGDILVRNSTSRSQHQNLELALDQLATIIRKALHVRKKRMATRVPKAVKAARVDTKTHRGAIKKMRSKKIMYD